MPIKFSEIATATSRLTFDLDVELKKLKSGQPRDLNSSVEQQDRREFLAHSIPNAAEAIDVFERVLAGNELQPASYLARGVIAAQAVCRVDVRRGPGTAARVAFGTGFLIAPQVLITNNHVIPAADLAVHSLAQFRYEWDLHDQPQAPIEYQLDPGSLFHTDRDLDFTIVAVRPSSLAGSVPLQQFGHLPLLATRGKALEGEWLTIVQHPSGEHKQLCVRENRLIKRTDDVLWYSTDTLGGSSGSPVFNNDWYVVALHHSGVPDREGEKIRGVDGQLYDVKLIREDQVKWIANEGIRASRIANVLRERLPSHPLLQPLFQATPETARIGLRSIVIPNNPPASGKTPMTSGNYASPVLLRIASDRAGQVQIDCQGQAASGARESTRESTLTYERSSAASAPLAAPDFVFDTDYSANGKRKGYNPELLGDDGDGDQISVLLPELTAGLEGKATKLHADFGGGIELKYYNFSVVMHSVRRFAILSAANVSAGNRFDMSRPSDVWRLDPRIPTSKQVANSYYANNKFDRGHLTRREDLEFGKTAKRALQSAADTCHWTNCTPQHAGFNQSREIWQGIERHILENAIQSDHLNAQVLTGPILLSNDPVYRNLQYPVSYWKVVAAINADDELAATAYIATQKQVIDQIGIELADPFGPFKNFQVAISEVERLTRLKFFFKKGGGPKTSLTDRDPFPGRPRNTIALSPGANEAAPAGYRELRALDEIVSGPTALE